MKGLKKLLMGLLVSIMVLGMGLTAFAAANDGSITISNARNGQAYKAYRVFDYAPADETKPEDGGVYKLSEKFAGLASDTKFAQYFTVGDNKILDTTKLTSANVAAFGADVLEYAKTNGIKEDASATADAGKDAAKDEIVSVTISGLAYGYYVVDSSLGSAVAVNTTAKNAEIEEKNDVPNVKKTVREDTTAEDVTGNNAQIGDTITFTVVADLKKGGREYKLVDTMTDGLTFKGITSVKAGESEYRYASLTTSEHGFEMTFDEPSEDVTVTVVYTAEVNTKAKIYKDVNENEAYLVYGNNVETTHKKTETKTYPLVIKKVAHGKENGDVLEGAVFNVYRKNSAAQVAFTVSEDGYTYTVDPNGTVTDVVTKAGKVITVNGLDAETYVLVETKAPTGFNLLDTSVEFGGKTYQHAQEVTIKEDASAATVATVVDSTGALLPKTGGIGTTIFYMLGGVLIVAAVAYFLLHRKAQAE